MSKIVKLEPVDWYIRIYAGRKRLKYAEPFLGKLTAKLAKRELKQVSLFVEDNEVILQLDNIKFMFMKEPRYQESKFISWEQAVELLGEEAVNHIFEDGVNFFWAVRKLFGIRVFLSQHAKRSGERERHYEFKASSLS